MSPKAIVLLQLVFMSAFVVHSVMAQGNTGMSLQQLEDRLVEIDTELGSLAHYSLRSGVGAIGYRSMPHAEPSHEEWIQIDFDDEYELDAIVLVPTIRRDAVEGFKDDALAKNLKFVLGTDNSVSGDTEEPTPGKVIASFSESDNLSPRIAPVVVECNGEKARWIRIEASNLRSRDFDGKYLFQLSEIMAFVGPVNVACDRPVTASSNVASGSPAWDKSFVVDGFVPFLMNSSNEIDKSLAFVSEVGVGERPQLVVDLEEEYSISEVRVHLVDQGDTVPQTFAGDFGMPGQLLIEGATKSDFSDATQLLDYRHSDYYDIGPIVSRRVPTTTCRYVRMIAIDPYQYDFKQNVGTRIAVSEFEILSNGKNVALEKKVDARFKSDNPRRQLKSITDGSNRYGKILPTLDWMNQLARRHDLERERPYIASAINQRYQQQRTMVGWLIGLAVLLAIGAVVAILVGWTLRARAVQRVRERIAADLHDELGANVHAIGLLSDLAQDSAGSPEKLKVFMGRIRELTERTGKATVHCVNLLESVGLFDDIEEDMRRTASRIAADLEKEITFEGQHHLEQLGSKQRIDLFLFFKESLTNIIRHSAATRISSHLRATPGELTLKIVDNGEGIQQSFLNTLTVVHDFQG